MGIIILIAGAALLVLGPKATGPGAATISGGSGLRGAPVKRPPGASSNPTVRTRGLVVGSDAPTIATGGRAPVTAPLGNDDARVISGVVNIGVIGSVGPFRGI